MKLKTKTYAMCLLVVGTVMSMSSYAQNIGINATGTPADNSAMLDVDVSGLPANNKKGLLIPRMTTAERNALPTPANSLLIFNTTTQCFEFWNAPTSSWVTLGCGCLSLPSAPTANASSGITQTNFTANWSSVSGATGYYLDVATDAGFTNFVTGYNNLNAGNVTSYNVSGLTCNTTYYYRVRAYNTTCGTSGNSNTITVTTSACPGICGSQVFMQQNMDVGTMINDPAEQNNDSQLEKYCYNNNAANCATYGGLYQWAEALQLPYTANSNSGYGTNCDPCGGSGIQGICPSGYHVPTDLEWSRYEWCIETTITPTGSTSLSTFQTVTGWRGTNSAAGPGHKMKVTSSNTPSWDGSNASGFSALPAGARNSGGGFYAPGSTAYFWSATEYSSTFAWCRYLSTAFFESGRNYTIKTYGFSVRCLQN